MLDTNKLLNNVDIVGFCLFVNFLLLNSRFIETILATLETTDSTDLVHIFLNYSIRETF